MKKSLFIFLAALFCFLQADAQKLSFGVKAGADLNKIDGKAFKQEFSFGYHAGAYADIGITKKFGIQPEVLLSQVSYDTTANFKDVYQISNISNTRLQYLKIPIMFNYYANPFVTLQVGPQYGILMNSDKTSTQNGVSAFKDGEFSLHAGIQLNISKFRIYGRYGVGLDKLNQVGNKDNWKSQTIHLGIGLGL